MRADKAGNLFLCGRFAGELNSFGGTLTHVGAGSSLVAASLRTDLSPRWAMALRSTAGIDGAHRVVPDDRGAVYLAGWFNGELDFSGTGETVRTSTTSGAAGSDMFLAKYNADDGRFQWAATTREAAPHANQNIVAGLAVDGLGDPWIGGQLFGATSFDAAGARVLQSAGANDAFVARYDGASGALR